MRACLVVASCFALACANYVARPIPPREAGVGPDRVRIDMTATAADPPRRRRLATRMSPRYDQSP